MMTFYTDLTSNEFFFFFFCILAKEVNTSEQFENKAKCGKQWQPLCFIFDYISRHLRIIYGSEVIVHTMYVGNVGLANSKIQVFWKLSSSWKKNYFISPGEPLNRRTLNFLKILFFHIVWIYIPFDFIFLFGDDVLYRNYSVHFLMPNLMISLWKIKK